MINAFHAVPVFTYDINVISTHRVMRRERDVRVGLHS
jgi:hypothetical protein